MDLVITIALCGRADAVVRHDSPILRGCDLHNTTVFSSSYVGQRSLRMILRKGLMITAPGGVDRLGYWDPGAPNRSLRVLLDRTFSRHCSDARAEGCRLD